MASTQAGRLIGSVSQARCHSLCRLMVILATSLFLASACSLSNDDPEPAESNAAATPNEIKPGESSPESVANMLSEQAEPTPATIDQSAPEEPAPAPIQDSLEPMDSTEASVPVDDAALTRLLLTDYIVEANQIVPTTSWICTDVFNQNRGLYFFSEGVLDAGRRVSIERTLNSNNTFDDIAFFWSVSASDSIIMASATMTDSGALLSTGQQYDVTGMRFFEAESRRSFTANSVLRGQITCALYDIR